MDKSLDAFFKAIRDSLEGHAKRKGYSDGPDKTNKMLEASVAMDFFPKHELGEILYKLGEYQAVPRRVLMEKVAGWAYLIWSKTSE